MHKYYEDYGNFDFIYNLPQTIYSILISSFIAFLFEFLALSEENLTNFKEKENLEYIEIEKKKEIKYLKIKNIIFFIIGNFLIIFLVLCILLLCCLL